VIVIGGGGLIGHKLWQLLPKTIDDVFTTTRKAKSELQQFHLFDSNKVIDQVDVHDFQHLEGILHAVNPDVVINCVGITKRKEQINDPYKAIYVNALYPHLLASWVQKNQKRMIHFSTDCVFNGSIGNYNEDSLTSAEDMYGRTKAMGEVRYDSCLTIRSSFIGRELEGKSELLEWFLAQNGRTIKGFHKAFYSGVSTIFMAKVVSDVILYHSDLSGLYQLATDNPISKYDLLHVAKHAFKYDVQIEPETEFVNINTLDGSKLQRLLGYSAPSWEVMMGELAADEIYHI